MITLSNGIKVVVKPTNFKNGEILFKGSSSAHGIIGMSSTADIGTAMQLLYPTNGG